MTKPLSLVDAFHNGFHYFVEALAILAKDPDAQCEALGDYNVAWELQDDVCAGEYVANSACGLLSVAETSAILSLTQAVKSVPVSNLQAGSGRKANLQAMQHVAWQPLREQATSLLTLLSPAIARNNLYFKSQSFVP